MGEQGVCGGRGAEVEFCRCGGPKEGGGGGESLVLLREMILQELRGKYCCGFVLRCESASLKPNE